MPFFTKLSVNLHRLTSGRFTSIEQTTFNFQNIMNDMKSIGYIGAFLGGAIAGAALGILMAPEKGQETRVKITDAVEDFLKKHNIKLSRKEVGDLVDDIQEAAEEE